jgi:hypothetical protein
MVSNLLWVHILQLGIKILSFEEAALKEDQWLYS